MDNKKNGKKRQKNNKYNYYYYTCHLYILLKNLLFIKKNG